MLRTGHRYPFTVRCFSLSMIGTIVSSDRVAVSVHAHEVGHNAARRIETFAHVRRIRVQEKAVGIIEVEYGLPT